jgi:hypothetical protein
MTKQTAKQAIKPLTSRRARKRRRSPDHHEISERAYFIHLNEGSGDELANWLRAERELTKA